MSNIENKVSYLDNGDSTRMLPEVLEEILPYLSEHYGNPASLHQFGLDAEEAIDSARSKLAEAIGAKPAEIIFTSGATESNNLALNGLRYQFPDKRHLIISPIEHASVDNIAKRWSREGWAEVTKLKVNSEGFVDPDSLRSAIRDDTLLVSVIHGNMEIGTIQNLTELGEICREKGVLLHSDCAQTFGKIPLNIGELPVDLASFNAHKMHGPKGVGALYIRKKVKVRRYFEGSPQEHGVRPGTENVPGIIGFAKAAEIAIRDMDKEMKRVDELAGRLADGLMEIEHVGFNGPPVGKNRLPGNVNITFRYIEGEAILMHLNIKGVYVSSGSACSSTTLEPSHVLTAIGLLHEDAHGSIRYTLSRLNDEEDVQRALQVTNETVKQLRAMTAFIPEKHSKHVDENAQTFYKHKND
ncbi:MAG: cysteine desulfurase family protein [Candidatus Electryonea clarkiae]|nr:cysteine desulfurase family protein [Candidatus Electryonea clarkiae]MDP8288176.1 cysteine desulfurase family protein [Candidatus Electryonea clarkiae]